MTFKELAEQTLREYPEGILVRFNSDDPNSDSTERYLDGNYKAEFSHVLDAEVNGYYLDDESNYEILEVFFNFGAEA